MKRRSRTLTVYYYFGVFILKIFVGAVWISQIYALQRLTTFLVEGTTSYVKTTLRSTYIKHTGRKYIKAHIGRWKKYRSV